MSRNRCDTRCQCGFPLDEHDRDTAELITSDAYFDELGTPTDHPWRDNDGHGWSRNGGPVHFRKIVCALCGATFAGWYERLVVSARWTLVDSSYYHAFNDEPADEDKPQITDVPAELTRLRAERDALRATLDASVPDHNRVLAERDRLRAEVVALRGLVREYMGGHSGRDSKRCDCKSCTQARAVLASVDGKSKAEPITIDVPPLAPDQLVYIERIQEWERESKRLFSIRIRRPAPRGVGKEETRNGG